MKLFLIKNQKNYTNQLLENVRTKTYTHLLKTLLEPDLADMQLISKFDKGFQFLQLLVKFIANMHDLFTPLRDKKGVIITNAFQKFLNESKHKPNKIWVGFK